MMSSLHQLWAPSLQGVHMFSSSIIIHRSLLKFPIPLEPPEELTAQALSRSQHTIFSESITRTIPNAVQFHMVLETEGLNEATTATHSIRILTD